jgi:hypothetical protein
MEGRGGRARCCGRERGAAGGRDGRGRAVAAGRWPGRSAGAVAGAVAERWWRRRLAG